MKKTYKIIALVVVGLLLANVSAAATYVFPGNGGLGTQQVPTSGQIPIGTNGGVYTPANITAGSNVTVTNSSGGITISATGGGAGTNYLTNSGSNTFLNTGTNLQAPVVIATSTTATSSFANLSGKLNAGSFASTDIGTNANTAYTGAPPTGVNVFIPATSSLWAYTTGISAATRNKLLRVTCDIGGSASNNATNGTILEYTPSTGTSTVFNTNDYVTSSGSGIEGCNMWGTNGTTARTTVGVEFGGANGAFDGYLSGTGVSGFGTGVYYGQNTSFNTIKDSVINFNGRNISEPNTSGANCENLRLLNDVIADSNNQTGGVTDLKGMYSQQSGNCQWNIGFTSFDDNQIFADQYGGTANIWNISNTHFENPNGHVYPMIASIVAADNTVWNISSTDFMNDTVAGQSSVIQTAGTVNLSNVTIDSNNNVTNPVTNIVDTLASSTVIVWSGLTCKGASVGDKVYSNVPCSPMGVGSGYGAPSFYVASTTAAHTGFVGMGTAAPDAQLTVDGGTSNAPMSVYTGGNKVFKINNSGGGVVIGRGTDISAFSGDALDVVQANGSDAVMSLQNFSGGNGSFLDLAANSNYVSTSYIGTGQSWNTGEFGGTSYSIQDATHSLTPWSVDNKEHVVTGGNAPTCGTGCAAVIGDDQTLRVTTGSGVTSITVNFNQAYSKTPVCIATEESGGSTFVAASSTLSTVVLTAASALTTKFIGVQCQMSSNF